MSRKPSRKINVNQIISFFDQYGDRISVISYRRWNKKKILENRNINIFQAFREITLRNSIFTIAIIALDLPINIEKYKDVRKYELVIHDYYFGSSKEENIMDDKKILKKKIKSDKIDVQKNVE